MAWKAKAFGAAIVAAVLAVLVSVVAFGRPLGSTPAPAALSAGVAVTVIYLNR